MNQEYDVGLGLMFKNQRLTERHYLMKTLCQSLAVILIMPLFFAINVSLGPTVLLRSPATISDQQSQQKGENSLFTVEEKALKNHLINKAQFTQDSIEQGVNLNIQLLCDFLDLELEVSGMQNVKQVNQFWIDLFGLFGLYFWMELKIPQAAGLQIPNLILSLLEIKPVTMFPSCNQDIIIDKMRKQLQLFSHNLKISKKY